MTVIACAVITALFGKKRNLGNRWNRWNISLPGWFVNILNINRRWPMPKTPRVGNICRKGVKPIPSCIWECTSLFRNNWVAGLQVLAEGVASQAEFETLRKLGFDGATGPAVVEQPFNH